jgi:hypothetical protein
MIKLHLKLKLTQIKLCRKAVEAWLPNANSHNAEWREIESDLIRLLFALVIVTLAFHCTFVKIYRIEMLSTLVGGHCTWCMDAEQRTCCICTYGALVTEYAVAYCCNYTVLTCLYNDVDSLMNCTYLITLCTCCTMNYMITATWNWYLIALVSMWCTCVHWQLCVSWLINVVSHFYEQREFVWDAAWEVHCQPQHCRNCLPIGAQYLHDRHLGVHCWLCLSQPQWYITTFEEQWNCLRRAWVALGLRPWLV